MEIKSSESAVMGERRRRGERRERGGGGEGRGRGEGGEKLLTGGGNLVTLRRE